MGGRSTDPTVDQRRTDGRTTNERRREIEEEFGENCPEYIGQTAAIAIAARDK